MSFTQIFYGHVDRQGKLQIDQRFQQPLMEHLRGLIGKPVEVTVKGKRRQRSLDQNSYLHAAVFPPLAEKFGNTIDEVKYALMGECFGWKRDPISGREVPIKPHTSDMTVEEARQFIDWVIPWAMTEYEVTIYLPNEIELSA